MFEGIRLRMELLRAWRSKEQLGKAWAKELKAVAKKYPPGSTAIAKLDEQRYFEMSMAEDEYYGVGCRQWGR